MKKEFSIPLSISLMLVILLSACGSGVTQIQTPAVLTIMTHDAFQVSADVIAAFEQANQVKVNFIKSGDAGAVLNKAILSKEAPLADVLYGVDNTFLSRAQSAGIFEAYHAPALTSIPVAFKLDPGDFLLPVDYGDICIVYDKAWFASHNLAAPQTFEDLVRPEYAGLLVMENPATSSPGLAFLLASIAHFGEGGYLDFWRNLRANRLAVVDDWTTAYYTNFSGSSGHGEQPLVISYASDPAAEVVFATSKLTESPVAVVTSPGTCFRQVEFVGILKGTQQRLLAQKFIDFMLDLQFQQDLPLQNFVYPVNPQAKLPEVFLQFAQVPEQPASLSPDQIAAGREKWISDWTATVLH